MKRIWMIMIMLCLLSGCTGVSKSQQKEIDKNIAEWSEKLVGPTWWDEDKHFAYRFYEDGRVEEDGYISEPGNWYISFGEQYNPNTDVSKLSKKFIKEYCDYYVRFKSPAYKVEEKYCNFRIRFDDNGNLYFFDELYTPGVDYIHEIPEDAYLDSYFYGNFSANNWGVWAFIGDDGKEGKLWVFQDDGYMAETVGSYGGELIYPSVYKWAFKDDYLYLEALRDEDYIAEYGRDIDVYRVEKGNNEFYITSYLDFDGNNRERLAVTDKLDIYSQ